MIKRDNRLWRPENRDIQATFVLCEQCGEAYEADREHICRKVNSYPGFMPDEQEEELET